MRTFLKKAPIVKAATKAAWLALRTVKAVITLIKLMAEERPSQS